ncbi:MAG: ParB N-terminal domain-containing protein [Candidatus Pacebacteria bacterium]|nr:ParB N-terminal domain-containing protein [Candidatus Paceibacterota bacterium]MBP9772764.1 ParB N-terminal domain-containing protein [Candidatus Paceibacterota bacterium]
MAKTKGILKEIKIEDIVTKRNFRKGLNQKWAEQLSTLYANKVEVEPIVVTPIPEKEGKYELVKGRHRIHGRKLADFSTIKAYVRLYEDEADMVVDAIAGDINGALPMTHEDFVVVANQLLELTGSVRQVVIRLEKVMDRKLAQSYAKTADDHRRHKKISKAMDAVIDKNMRPSDAAEEYGVSEEDLKARIKLRNRGNAKGRKRYHIRDFTGNVGKTAGVYNRNTIKFIEEAIEAWEKNEFASSDIFAIIEHAKKKNEEFSKNIKQIEDRFRLESEKEK